MGLATRVVLVEDDADLRECLCAYLQKTGLDVIGLCSGQEYLSALQQNNFDIAVLDIGLPDQSGLELAKITREQTKLGIIFLTARSTDDDVVKGYESGGDIYLTKPVDCRILAASIRSLADRLRGNRICDGSWSLCLDRWILTAPDGRDIRLTIKERQLIEVLANRQGEAVSRDCLAERLYSRSDAHTNRALDSLVRRLRRKLGQGGAGEPLGTAQGVGYVFVAPCQVR